MKFFFIFVLVTLVSIELFAIKNPMDGYEGNGLVKKALTLVEEYESSPCKLQKHNDLKPPLKHVFYHFNYVCGEAVISGRLDNHNGMWKLRLFDISTFRGEFKVDVSTRTKWLKAIGEEFKKDFPVQCKEVNELNKQVFDCTSTKDPKSKWELELKDQTEKRGDIRLEVHLEFPI